MKRVLWAACGLLATALVMSPLLVLAMQGCWVPVGDRHPSSLELTGLKFSDLEGLEERVSGMVSEEIGEEPFAVVPASGKRPQKFLAFVLDRTGRHLGDKAHKRDWEPLRLVFANKSDFLQVSKADAQTRNQMKFTGFRGYTKDDDLFGHFLVFMVQTQ